jgi:DNA transformation protein and related proteins
MPKSDPHRFDDLFCEFGPITLRRFFGGEGIYAGDIMIGMIFGDIIYFKTDEETRKPFLAARTKPFTFKKGGETVVTGWYALPDRLYDEPDELAEWARAAHGVAAASPTTTRKRAQKNAKKKRKRG